MGSLIELDLAREGRELTVTKNPFCEERVAAGDCRQTTKRRIEQNAIRYLC
jgi:hypothetical protein